MKKFLSLVFDYNFQKMFESGRIWGKTGYKNKEYIFEYSAASIATVLHQNPDITYEIWTDDPALLSEKVSKYDVSTRNLVLLDKSKEIADWSQHRYCFWPAVKIVDENLTEDKIIKLDNDLTCLKPCDELFDYEGALVWKYERICARGRDYWGESYAAVRAYGTADFPIYNIGVFYLHPKFHSLAREIPNLCEDMLNVDISPIVRFTEDPGVTTKMWSCSEQTADSYFVFKNGIPVRETHDFFEHHCYTHGKQACIERAKHLLRS